MPTTLTNGIQLPDKGSVDWYSSMQSNYNLIDTHLGDTDVHVTAEDKARWDGKQGSLSQAQLDAIAQVATNTDDIATLQSGKADASHTHSSSDITDIDDYATKDYVDNSISGLVDNAPAALDTLNELSAALNDDSNFASTVTNALATKADSADLATVATSGSYNDLSNKPTINDSTITIQKNGSTVDTFTTNGSNKTINIPVPTKTSDLTNDSDFVVSSSLAAVATSGFYNDLDNKPYIPDKISDLIDDSNFVDTSNPAVSSGITSAKVTDYDTHIADTGIHVTTTDKNKWNNQTYVFRYSSTALTPSSTNFNALLDNTNNLKVGDKVIDSSGVLFSITAIDTANSTFTIGTALIDLAQDSDVVHKIRDETIGGEKTFSNIISSNGSYLGNEASANERTNLYLLANRDTDGQSGAYIGRFRQNRAQGTMSGGDVSFVSFDFLENSTRYTRCFTMGLTDWDSNGVPQTYYITSPSYKGALGTAYQQWNKVYANEYYYGSNNVEFSNKFVTTDTNQTISETKTFTNTIKSQKEIEFTGHRLAYILPEFSASYSGLSLCTYGSNGAVKIGSWKVDDNDNTKHVLNDSLGYLNVSTGAVNSVNIVYLTPRNASKAKLGDSVNKWHEINGLEPSSLSLPSGNLNDVIDISSYITDLSGNVNNYTAPANGWISILMYNCSGVQGYITGLWGHQIVRPTVGVIRFLMPVLKNQTANILVFGGTIDNARFIPCQGNV